MASHACKHAACSTLLESPGYCSVHAGAYQTIRENRRAEVARQYSKFDRSPEAIKFYGSIPWKNCRASIIASKPICERCKKTFAQHVHHVIPFSRCTLSQRIDPANLMALCQPCHNSIEAEAANNVIVPPTPTGTLAMAEDDEFYYDAEAAEKPVRFIEKYCRHYEGKWAGQEFKLLDWQKEKIVRPLFGWKRRSDNLRRFQSLYLISAKGAGKTPLLSGIGLYMLLGDEEAAAHVISMASSFEQANYTFDAAKKYINQSKSLSGHCEILQYLIKAPKYSKWSIISGKPTGRSGSRPSCIIADECHEWEPATAKGFDLLCANLFKREQPLLLIATNAGNGRNGFSWSIHERATGVLDKSSNDKTLMPVIFEAPGTIDWQSEEAAMAANPSIPAIVKFEQIKNEQMKGEKRYRRLYLSQWVTGSDKWLDLRAWDAMTEELDYENLKKFPLYLGVDGSKSDDLFAIARVWVAPDRFYVDCKFWLPMETAQIYEQKMGIPYLSWEEQGDITLLEEATISPLVQKRIAGEVIESCEEMKVKEVAFDRAYGSDCVKTLEAAGMTCIGVGQGWGVSLGCAELERRIKEKSISIARNSVLRACAENAETKSDQRGNYWPVKPNATDSKHTGKRSAKIDGITAMVTALTRAREHEFPAGKSKPWAGNVWIV